MDNLILITTTSDDRDELEKIAAHLVKEKLAACCQIGGPVSSWFTWEGQQESTLEWVCSIKTTSERFPDVAQAIAKLHHYEEPQIFAVDVCAASFGYEQWVRKSVVIQ